MQLTEIEKKSANELIRLALEEDVGSGDITTDNLIPAGDRRKAILISKANGVIAGLEVAEMVFRKFDLNLEWNPRISDGCTVRKGEVIAEFTASYRALLTGERTALNFLQRMSGIATISTEYVRAVQDFSTKILDTRKTLPGFRLLDKYSVKVGGAANHRMGLYDMVMIKDNHIAVAGGIAAAVGTARAAVAPSVKIEIETTNLDEVQQAIDAGADIIMLDNMNILSMRDAVNLIAGRAKTEASGNMTLDRLREVASTGEIGRAHV